MVLLNTERDFTQIEGIKGLQNIILPPVVEGFICVLVHARCKHVLCILHFFGTERFIPEMYELQELYELVELYELYELYELA